MEIRIKEPSTQPCDISYYQYKEFAKNFDNLKSIELTFFLVPTNDYYTDTCFASLKINDKESISMPVNPRIARNLIHLAIGKDPIIIQNWKLFESGMLGEIPPRLRASSDMLGLLMLVEDALRLPYCMVHEKGFYYFIWNGRKDRCSEYILYWIKVKIKETIETTIELKNRGFEYDRNSLRMER